MDWLNFGNFQDNGGQPTEDELSKKLSTEQFHQSLADYMNANYGQQGTGKMPPVNMDGGQVNWQQLAANHPDFSNKQWYLSASDNHGKSGLGSILAMIGA